MNKLSVNFGDLIGRVDEEDYYAFPPPERLVGDHIETKLRGLGFGYRAKYIPRTADMIVNEREGGWLESLRNKDYKSVHSSLCELSGVGPKVADCVVSSGSYSLSEGVDVFEPAWCSAC